VQRKAAGSLRVSLNSPFSIPQDRRSASGGVGARGLTSNVDTLAAGPASLCTPCICYVATTERGPPRTEMNPGVGGTDRRGVRLRRIGGSKGVEPASGVSRAHAMRPYAAAWRWGFGGVRVEKRLLNQTSKGPSAHCQAVSGGHWPGRSQASRHMARKMRPR